MRALLVGCSGSGKSTLGRELARRSGAPYVELDALFHQPGWTELPREEFRARVSDVVAGDGWVVDGNYSAVQDLVLARADVVVWFDLPRGLVMRQVLRRTFGRLLGPDRELWNGNRESWRNALSWEPERSILRWTWTQHPAYRERYAAAAAAARPGQEWVRVRSREDLRRWLRDVVPG